MAVIEHGNIVATDHPSGDKGVHVLQGFVNTAHEGTRKAINILAADVGRVVRQTGGAVPALYEANATGTGLDKWTQIGASVTTQDVTLFVRTGVGSDTADGLTNGTSLATGVEAVARTPRRLAHSWIVRLGDGTYPNFEWGDRDLGDHLAVYGDGAGSGDGFSRLQTSETADTGTDANKVVKTGGGLTVNVFRNKTIILLTGPGAGQRRMISRNTATDIVPSLIFIPAPDNTTTYEVVESTVLLSYTTATFETIEISGSGPRAAVEATGGTHSSEGTIPTYVLAQLKLTASVSSVVAYSRMNVAYYGVEIEGAEQFIPSWTGGSVFAGADDLIGFASLPVNLGFTAGSGDWVGWGLGSSGAKPPAFRTQYAVMQGYFVVGSINAAGPGTKWVISGGGLYGNAVGFVDTLTARGADGAEVSIGGAGPAIEIDATGAFNPVQASLGARISMFGSIKLTAAAALVRSESNASVFVADTVTGTSSGGAAVEAHEGGKVFLTGSAEPVLVGNVPASAYDPGGLGAVAAAFFAADGDFTSNADGSVILRESP